MVSQSTSSIFTQFQTRIGQVTLFRAILGLLVLVFIVGCQGQTFQYSRGWTNGKRSGSPMGPSVVSSQSSSFDGENGGAGPSMEDPSSAGTLRLRANGPQGRLRSVDYAQYLNKKLGSIGGNRKPPVWILGVDSETNSNGGEF